MNAQQNGSPRLSSGARVLVWIMGIIALIHSVDFFFYGFRLQNLLAAAGFATMCYGTVKGGFDKTGAHALAHRLSMIGVALVLVPFVLRWVQ